MGVIKNKEKHHKVEFAYVPYPLQREILDHMDGIIKNPKGEPYRFIVPILGRQTGKSWLARFAILDRSINRRQITVWIAPTLPTARSHWNEIVSDVEASGIPVKKKNEQTKEIHFFGGGSITVRSAIEPDNLRGLSPNFIVMDEAAFFRNGRYVWFNVVLPMVTASRGVVFFPTTPNGRNWIYELYEQGQKPEELYYKSWRVPSSASPYQDLALLAELKKTMPLNKWLAEFEVQFLSGEGSIFHNTEDAAITPPQMEPLKEQFEDGEFYIGVDAGFASDHTAVTVLFQPFDGGNPRQVFGERWTELGTLATLRRVWDIALRWSAKKVVIEKNGMGETLMRLFREIMKGEDIDLLKDIYVSQADVEIQNSVRSMMVEDIKVIFLHVDNQIKRTLVEDLATRIEYGRLDLLSKDVEYGKVQLNEMSTLERQTTKNGVDVTYNAEEGSHDDTVSALYLATYGLPRGVRIRKKKQEAPKDKRGNKIFRGRGKSLRRG